LSYGKLASFAVVLIVMESSRTCLGPRGSLRTHFQVLGLGLVAHVLGLGLESGPWPCEIFNDT